MFLKICTWSAAYVFKSTHRRPEWRACSETPPKTRAPVSPTSDSKSIIRLQQENLYSTNEDLPKIPENHPGQASKQEMETILVQSCISATLHRGAEMMQNQEVQEYWELPFPRWAPPPLCPTPARSSSCHLQQWFFFKKAGKFIPFENLIPET